jgi:multidrug efflux system outer membrane protein
VPRSADAAARLAVASAPAVLPLEQTAETQTVLDEVRSAGGATLRHCFRLAELTNEGLLSGDEDRLQAALKRDLAAAGLSPTLALSAFAFVQDRVPSNGSGGGSSGSGSSNSGSGSSGSSSDREQWAMTVRQPIFRGFAEVRALEAFSRTAEAKTAAIDAMRAALRKSVARAFYGVLEAEAETRTLEDSERLDRSRVEEMRARQEAGIARRTEVMLLESQLEQTRATLRRARTQREITRTALDQLLGVDLPAPPVAAAAIAPCAPSRDAALFEAIASRPELRAAGLATAAAEAQVGVARAGYWPVVSFVGDWYIGRSGFSPTTKATDWDAQIALDFPFFEGGATQVRERAAKSDVRKARLAESELLRAVVHEVESALAAVAGDAELLASFEHSARIAEENLKLLEEEYRQGIATNLEVLTAQNVLQEAQRDVERQRLENQLDLALLLLSLGRTEIQP